MQPPVVKKRRRMRHPALAGCLTALVATAPLWAQGEEDELGLQVDPAVWIGAGERVRVTVQGVDTSDLGVAGLRRLAAHRRDDQYVMTGSVVSVNESGFGLDPGDSKPISVRYKDLQRLERSLGRKNYSKEGLGLGLTPGLLVLLLAAALNEEGDEAGAKEVLGGGLLIASAGGLLGMVIGAAISWEEWEPLPIPSMGGALRIRPMIEAASSSDERRAVLGARIRF